MIFNILSNFRCYLITKSGKNVQEHQFHNSHLIKQKPERLLVEKRKRCVSECKQAFHLQPALALLT